jgi:hypothetical protein
MPIPGKSKVNQLTKESQPIAGWLSYNDILYVFELLYRNTAFAGNLSFH